MTVNFSGPLFDARRAVVLDRMCDGIERDVAQRGVNLVHTRLGQVLRHPTGRYESRIVSSNRADSRVVSDSNIVYGPWLEGVGSRNATTRFKGYHTFRLVAQAVDRESAGIADDVVAREIGALR